MRTSAPGQSALLLLDVISILNTKKVSYAVIGAFAVSFYGIVRASLDADVIVALPGTTEIKALCRELKSEEFTVRHHHADRDDPISDVINVEDSFGNRVDLINGLRGMEKDLFSRAKQTEFQGLKIKIVSPEDLIAMKIFAGSPKDIHDAEGILKVSGKKIDLKLLHDLTSRYGKRYLKQLESLGSNKK